MSWLLALGAAIVLGVVLAYLFPATAQQLLRWFNAGKMALLAVVGGLTALYLLTSGTFLYVLIGMVGIVIIVWQVMFNDPFGWVKPLLP